jgi:diguanylate cyclase (GGDEF)-like protein
MSQAQRRLEDREVSILMVEPGVSGAGTAPDTGPDRSVPLVVRYGITTEDESVTATRPHQEGWKLDASAFVLDLPGESEAVLVVGPELRLIARGEGGPELLRRAAQGAAAWRRERARALHRLKLPDRLLAFSEELNRAHSLHTVCSALVDHVGRIVGGYTGLVYLHENVAGKEALRPADHPWISRRLAQTSLNSDLRFLGPGLVETEAVAAGSPGRFANLREVFQETGAARMAYVALGDWGMLFVIERRDARTFEAEDWDLLRSVARQAEVALERVSLFQRVQSLSLTDPLTGLGNRRKLEVVMEHAFSAARRGHPLSVVMVDLDGFKEFNETHGHVRGDEMLKLFAQHLQEQVRGSDVVIRYGGDEFLFVLTGTDADTAQVMVDRLAKRVQAPLHFTAGIAQYQPSMNSPSELIGRADHALYERRRGDRRSRQLTSP